MVYPFCFDRLVASRSDLSIGSTVVDAFEQDYEDLESLQEVHFGSATVSDDLLMESLFARTSDFVDRVDS